MTLAPGGWTAAKALMLLSCLGAAPWVGFCAANGLIGFVLRLPLPRDRCRLCPSRECRPRERRHAPPSALTVRNEDMAQVLPPVRRLLDGLDAAAVGDAFALFVLSDSDSPETEEAGAVAAFRDGDRLPDRIHYRRRQENTGFKAGNVMDFLDHHANGFELMLILDADSDMTPAAVLRLIAAMRQDPTLGIIQHLTVGCPRRRRFPRLFSVRHARRHAHLATALSWWQGGRVRLLGPQRDHPHRAVPDPLPPAASTGWQTHSLTRPGGGGDAARRRLGHPPAA